MCDSLSGNELLHLQDLFSALQSANFGQLVGLLGKSKVLELVQSRSNFPPGCCPLTYCVSNNLPDHLELLLARGAISNLDPSLGKKGPLLVAIQNEDPRMVRALVEYGAILAPTDRACVETTTRGGSHLQNEILKLLTLRPGDKYADLSLVEIDARLRLLHSKVLIAEEVHENIDKLQQRLAKQSIYIVSSLSELFATQVDKAAASEQARFKEKLEEEVAKNRSSRGYRSKLRLKRMRDEMKTLTRLRREKLLAPLKDGESSVDGDWDSHQVDVCLLRDEVSRLQTALADLAHTCPVCVHPLIGSGAQRIPTEQSSPGAVMCCRQCSNFVCLACSKRLTTCPICRSDLIRQPLLRNRAAERILEAICNALDREAVDEGDRVK